jgi:hypothetical protein
VIAPVFVLQQLHRIAVNFLLVFIGIKVHEIFDLGAVIAYIVYAFQLPIQGLVEKPAQPVIFHIAVNSPDQEVKINGINDIPFRQTAGF